MVYNFRITHPTEQVLMEIYPRFDRLQLFISDSHRLA
jgi:hypothetical protein